ncbi:MAG: HD domain-containing protein [Gaiellales bacterium]
MSNVAAIDIGTNSIHLVVARPVSEDRFEVLAREKEVVRLGKGSGDMKRLDQGAIERAVDTLRRFARLAQVSDAEIAAVATSATREATNRDDLIDRARVEAGVEIEVISGVEEARLIRLGVLQAVPVYDASALVIDVGGGSTELVIGRGDAIHDARSVKVGAIRLTDRFFAAEPLRKRHVRACREYLRAFLAPVVRDLRRLDIDCAVGSSGTIGSVAAMVAAARGDDPERSLNAFEFSNDDLQGVLSRLTAADTAKRRAQVPGLDPKRSDIILAGVVLLDEIFAGLGLTAVTFSEYALREGVLLDRLRQAAPHGRHLSDLRRASVLHVARMYDEDIEHADRTARLAVELWGETRPLHGLDEWTVEILEAAALLHNVGLFVSHSAHHRHSYYVIRNSEHLSGFTDREIELIALVARYHRKSAPRAKHPEFAVLPPRDAETVRTLAGLLRIAIGLDRTYDGVVRGVKAAVDDGRLLIAADVRPGADASLELYTARDRRSLLENALGVSVQIMAGRPGEAAA